MFRTLKANAALAGLVCGLLMASCSFVAAPETAQCETNADCQDLGFTEMTCVNSLCQPIPGKEQPHGEGEESNDPRFACKTRAWDLPGEGTVAYNLNVSQLLGGKPYNGLTVQICPSFDAKCENPQGEATSDANGNFTLNLPVGFRGHLLAATPKADPTLVPVEAYVFPPPSLNNDVPKRPGLVVTNISVIQGLASLDSATVVPGTGHLIFTVFGCDAKPLEGITVRTSITQEETWRAYVGIGGRPDPRLKATGPTGQGAILNLPPGYIKVIGEHPTLGKIFEQSIVIAANRLTSVPVVPSPVPKS